MLDLSEAVRMVMENEITHGPRRILIEKTYLLVNGKKAEISR